MTETFIGTIKKHSQSQNKIYLYQEWLPKNMNNEVIWVSYGQEKTKAIVVATRKKETIALSQDVWNRLSIPFSHLLHISWKDNTLKLGPLVGIFTTGVHHHSSHPVGPRTGLVKHYIRIQKDVPLSYFVFGPHDISSNGQRINAYFATKASGGEWIRRTVPLPDVVFDRVPNRTSEKASSVFKAKKILENRGTKIFNPGFFNKWTIHQHIKDQQEIQQFIPETIMRPKKEQLIRLLKKYRMVYLKPAGGSLGLGIIQLNYHPQQGGIIARYRSHNQNNVSKFSSISAMLQHFFKNKSLSNYIAQQGISLIEIDDRPIDLRVHTNKDRQGRWKVTAVAAKIAGRGSVTTHMRTGGKVLTYEDVLKRCFPEKKRQEVFLRLEEAALMLSQVIEENLPGYIGELGFDIGIDKQGHPWMFEANSKPGRHIFVHNSLKEADYLTRRFIVEYALHLANFSTKDVTT